MPLSTLDTRTALVVVDLQKGIAASVTTVHPLSDIVERSAVLAAAFRARGLPVVLVNVTGGAPGRNDASKQAAAGPTRAPDWAELLPELGAQPSDHLVTKTRWGAFYGTDLDAYLTEQGVTQVVLTGVATSIGVESTARSAGEHGYHVVLVVDAMTDRDADAHQNSVERIFPRLGETTSTAEVLAMLEQAYVNR
jgi:nicotinamidase-related amidase